MYYGYTLHNIRTPNIGKVCKVEQPNTTNPDTNPKTDPGPNSTQG